MFTFVPSFSTALTSRMLDLSPINSAERFLFSRISTEASLSFPARPSTAFRKPSNWASEPFSPMTLQKRKSLRGFSRSGCCCPSGSLVDVSMPYYCAGVDFALNFPEIYENFVILFIFQLMNKLYPIHPLIPVREYFPSIYNYEL